MSEVTDEQKMHHYMGIEMNIQTWNLLGKEDRNEKDDARMINFAHASLYHWRKSHKYKPINEQRGQWMLSHVYAVLGKGEEAISYAAAGNNKECTKWLEKAQEACTLISTEEDKKYFVSDLENEPWFGCK